MLRSKFFDHPLQLFSHPIDLPPRRGALLVVQLHCLRVGQPSLRAAHDRGDHLQIAHQFAHRTGRRLGLPLRFEKQPGIIQNASADHRRSPPPGGIQLPGLACIAVMRGEYRRHTLAVLQALPRHGRQNLHRYLGADLPLTHLLLDGFRQQFHQCQPPRRPAHAAVEPPRQLIQAVAETQLQLLKQPAHLQRRFLLPQTQRTIQQYRRRFAHRPYHGLHRVPSQLLQRGDPLVTINDYVAVRLAFGRHHHDGRLLPAVGQRSQQPPLPPRVARPQVLPTPIELMKLQLHRQADCKANPDDGSISPD